MKNWKIIVLLAGILLLVASSMVYLMRISSCYPPANIWAQYTPEYISGMRQTCNFDSSIPVQFLLFLVLFVPGISLFSVYWLATRPTVKSRHGGALGTLIILIVIVCALVMMYGLLEYPAPGNTHAPAAWVGEFITVLGFICYFSLLALWHWKRWGLVTFLIASVALVAFLLLGAGSLLLAGAIIVGILGILLLIRPVRYKLV